VKSLRSWVESGRIVVSGGNALRGFGWAWSLDGLV
jgi:hypothetical protein